MMLGGCFDQLLVLGSGCDQITSADKDKSQKTGVFCSTNVETNAMKMYFT